MKEKEELWITKHPFLFTAICIAGIELTKVIISKTPTTVRYIHIYK